MISRYTLETITGITIFSSVMLIGEKGIAFIGMLSFLPFLIRKKKYTDHDYFLFYRSANLNLVIFLFLASMLYILPNYIKGLVIFKTHQFYFLLALYLISHGMSGLFTFFNKEEITEESKGSEESDSKE